VEPSGQQELRARIQSFLSSGEQREITEDGDLLFGLGETQFRLQEAQGKLLLHLWSSERNWVRRVLRIAEETPERLVIEVERFGQKRPGKLLVAIAGGRVSTVRERAIARRKYSAWLRRLLTREFCRARFEGVSTTADRKRSFSGLYTRARLGEGKRWWAVLGVNAGEGSAAADGLLTYALLWLNWNRGRYPERAWAGLRLFLPQGNTQTTLTRLAFLSPPEATVEVYATNEEEFTCSRVDERDIGNLETHLAPARRAEEILAAESSAVERIRALAPQVIETVAVAGRPQLTLRFRGLEFARSEGGRVSFGVGRTERPLTERNFGRLAALVERLGRERTADGPPKSPYYRLQPERWLESLVLAKPQAIDPRLDPTRLYRQVPALSGGERGLVDLLGVTRNGQLIVMELKASSDIHLLLQGLDYWLRVHWHHQRGELSSYDYFPGGNLKPDPPELLLAAPGLQFHPATEICARFLAPAVRVTLVGLNEDWRRQLKVVFRRSLPRMGK
jgi:hypothetical protein